MSVQLAARSAGYGAISWQWRVPNRESGTQSGISGPALDHFNLSSSRKHQLSSLSHSPPSSRSTAATFLPRPRHPISSYPPSARPHTPSSYGAWSPRSPHSIPRPRKHHDRVQPMPPHCADRQSQADSLTEEQVSEFKEAFSLFVSSLFDAAAVYCCLAACKCIRTR